MVREVGDESMNSIMDRIVWGAVGTLMRLEISPFLTKYSPTVQKLFNEISSSAGISDSPKQEIE